MFENVTILVLVAAKVDYLFYYLAILPEAPACMTRRYLNHWTMGPWELVYLSIGRYRK